MLKFLNDMVENIVGKGENAGDQHFLLLPQCFQNALSTGSSKAGTVWQRISNLNALRLNKEVQNEIIVAIYNVYPKAKGKS